jgi:hypothetical protein
MPLAERPDLAADWEFLYERSIGCVGILKQWLTRTLHSVLRRGGNAVVREDLEKQALSVLQCQKIFSETAEGESQSAEPIEARRALQCQLGLGTGMVHVKECDAANTPLTVRKAKRRPGVRRPQRDRIGVAANAAF